MATVSERGGFGGFWAAGLFGLLAQLISVAQAPSHAPGAGWIVEAVLGALVAGVVVGIAPGGLLGVLVGWMVSAIIVLQEGQTVRGAAITAAVVHASLAGLLALNLVVLDLHARATAAQVLTFGLGAALFVSLGAWLGVITQREIERQRDTEP